MDDLPKSSVGKLLRVGLGARLGIVDVDEKSPARSRLLIADCPSSGVATSTPINYREVDVSIELIELAIREVCPVVSDVFVHIDDESGMIRAAIEVVGVDNKLLKANLHCKLHDYLVPRSIMLLESFLVIPNRAL